MIRALESHSLDEQNHTDPEALIREIATYLAAVDAFRAECCEPTWRPRRCGRPIRVVRRPTPRTPVRPTEAPDTLWL